MRKYGKKLKEAETPKGLSIELKVAIVSALCGVTVLLFGDQILIRLKNLGAAEINDSLPSDAKLAKPHFPERTKDEEQEGDKIDKKEGFSVNQSTSGDKSPAVFSLGGNININKSEPEK